jgi:hypothetical protein
MPTPFGADNRDVKTSGTWTKSCSPRTAGTTTLWQAVDQDGYTLDILMQSRRDRHAAKRFFCKLLKGPCDVHRDIVTDQMKRYGAAKREIMLGVEHRQHKGINNRAELSHRPTRQKKRQIRGFKSPKQAKRFVSAHAHIGNFVEFAIVTRLLQTLALLVVRCLKLGRRQPAPIVLPENTYPAI